MSLITFGYVGLEGVGRKFVNNRLGPTSLLTLIGIGVCQNKNESQSLNLQCLHAKIFTVKLIACQNKNDHESINLQWLNFTNSAQGIISKNLDVFSNIAKMSLHSHLNGLFLKQTVSKISVILSREYLDICVLRIQFAKPWSIVQL